MRLIFLAIYCFALNATAAPSRIKDIVNFEGIRDNLLVGYGLVVGLNGTGDNLTNSNFTKQGLTDFLVRMGVNTKGANLKTKNVAAVTITANLHAFARQGSKIDIKVSAIGDAKSLEGGTLLATPIRGADGEVYAVAQGNITISGIQPIGRNSTTANRGVSTSGYITNGAIVENEIDFDLNSLETINLSLINPDLSTSLAISSIINERLGDGTAYANDPATVIVNVSSKYKNQVVRLLSAIENLAINTDSSAKIIIDESSGTVVIGENVKLSSVALAHGNLSIVIGEQQNKKNNPPERGSKMQFVESNNNLQDLVESLNSLGLPPRDLITILQNLKSLGALQAEIEVR